MSIINIIEAPSYWVAESLPEIPDFVAWGLVGLITVMSAGSMIWAFFIA